MSADRYILPPSMGGHECEQIPTSAVMGGCMSVSYTVDGEIITSSVPRSWLTPVKPPPTPRERLIEQWQRERDALVDRRLIRRPRTHAGCRCSQRTARAMITGDCRECGYGPMDLPGDEICDDCRFELDKEEPWDEGYGDD